MSASAITPPSYPSNVLALREDAATASVLAAHRLTTSRTARPNHASRIGLIEVDGSTGGAMAATRISSQLRDGAERDRLLETKVTVPRPRAERLRRPHLIASLDEGMKCDVVLVCTPAGFGKTTLLAEWALRREHPVAWVSLDSDDNDPVRFWRYVIAALDRACPGIGRDVLLLLDPPNVATVHGVVTALINELEAASDEVALVLDDYHAIGAAPIHDSVAFLLSHLPPQLRLVIATRSDPPLPLARLRAAGALAELRGSDLRFTPEESAALLRDVWGLDVSPRTAAALDARTEGWAVGLQLAALSLQGRPDPDAFVDAFTGTHRFVLDYLGEEVLGRQPERVRTFLLRTSILERLSGPLCDAVTEEGGGQSMLEDLEHANMFLIPLDDNCHWYRFHHLFRDHLRARLHQSDPGSVRNLHRRAATWCEEHGLLDDAIRHALGSGDASWAAQLVEQRVDETLRSGKGGILERWLSALPGDVVRSRPALCLAEALMQLHVGSPDSVQSLVDHAERAFEQGNGSQEQKVPTAAGMIVEVPAAIALLRAELAGWRGDDDELARFANAAAAQMDEHEIGPRLWARILLADADWADGRLPEAERAMREVLAAGRATPSPYAAMSSCSELGRVQQAQGKLGLALRTYEEGLRFATEGGRLLPFHAGEAHIGIAQVLYSRDELDDALRHATKGVELTRDVVEFRLPAFGLVTLAWIRHALGNREGALEAVNEASRMFPAENVPSLWYPAPAERVRLLLVHGRVDDAARWIRERGLSEDDEMSYPHERDYLVLARVLLARSDPGRALGLLDRLDALAESQGRISSMIEIRALRALALQAAGDHDDALRVVADALSLAHPEGYVRVFADEGPRMAALLKSLIGARQRSRAATASNAEQAHLKRVLRAFAPAEAQAAVPPVTALVEPLTARELEVLSFIAAGHRNREIADELVVTLDTVKKHTTHIFDKLGAANRTEAVMRARELGLIS